MVHLGRSSAASDKKVLHSVLPDRINWNLIYAVAQDRWFFKG